MRIWLSNLWDTLHSSFWFVPTLMVAGGIGLAIGTLWFDALNGGAWMKSIPWLHASGPDEARENLSTIAGSVITVAGVVFSITIVVLTLASNQFGPRVLRRFMRDTGNQLVLGSFAATFVYCLLVLRSVGAPGEREGVPHLSVSVAVLLGVVSILVFIYFIHHVAASIQASNVVYHLHQELQLAISQAYPALDDHADEHEGKPPSEGELAAGEAQSRALCWDGHSGYLQVVDVDQLLALAEERGVRLKLAHRPGDFVPAGEAVAAAWPADRLQDGDEQRVCRSFHIGHERTQAQDVEFSIEQMVQVALRALSPSLNDPFTASTCVDYLASALIFIAKRRIPSRYRYDHHRQLRLVIDDTSFAGLVNAAFNQIRQNSADSVSVTVRLIEVLGRIGRQARSREQRQALLEQLRLVKWGSDQQPLAPSDRQKVEERYRAAEAVLLATGPQQQRAA